MGVIIVSSVRYVVERTFG